MEIEHILLRNLAAITLVILLLWGMSLLRRDASIVDIYEMDELFGAASTSRDGVNRSSNSRE